MRTTLTIDDQLYEQAVALTGIREQSVLFREGLKALIERESARHFFASGGNESNLESISRRRPGLDDK